MTGEEVSDLDSNSLIDMIGTSYRMHSRQSPSITHSISPILPSLGSSVRGRNESLTWDSGWRFIEERWSKYDLGKYGQTLANPCLSEGVRRSSERPETCQRWTPLVITVETGDVR